MKFLNKYFGDNGQFTGNTSISGQVAIITVSLVLLLVFSLNQL